MWPSAHTINKQSFLPGLPPFGTLHRAMLGDRNYAKEKLDKLLSSINLKSTLEEDVKKERRKKLKCKIIFIIHSTTKFSEIQINGAEDKGYMVQRIRVKGVHKGCYYVLESKGNLCRNNRT